MQTPFLKGQLWIAVTSTVVHKHQHKNNANHATISFSVHWCFRSCHRSRIMHCICEASLGILQPQSKCPQASPGTPPTTHNQQPHLTIRITTAHSHITAILGLNDPTITEPLTIHETAYHHGPMPMGQLWYRGHRLHRDGRKANQYHQGAVPIVDGTDTS